MAAVCTTCRSALPDGAKFCIECGTRVVAACPACGAPVPGGRFCAECGNPLATRPDMAAPPAAHELEPAVPGPVAERRLTSLLFADLVGFTTLSESRDPEEVRELLSLYFARARETIGLYGGTVEKFIGDAVMAVWGVPIAHEDDAERAVRAGLDLATLVRDLGTETGIEGLRLRVGVVTGEVAVTIGATGEGMVAGDSVNTAARVQAAATPGEVWVDEPTRALTEAAISYADAGVHELKGKAEPVRLFHAERVLGNRGGAGRVDGLDAGFIGRNRELRLVKELFHTTGELSQGRLVAVTGAAGIGKSRLAWEFEKYVDGITESVLWHHGRALAYGSGVAMGALAEMVRSRVGVTDPDETPVVMGKLDGSLAELLPDAQERAWVRARLAVLLGLPGAPVDLPRIDLFTAWRVFFERVAQGEGTVVLVVEDAQYADQGLLDFLDFLVDTATFPVFVMTLARPELEDSRPGWGTGRKALSVYLEPLGDASMGDLLDQLVDGLPPSARNALVASSEGLPLYALETVRGLIDRDVVVPHEGRYVLAAGSGALVDFAASEAPTSLRALIASRLDALPAEERRSLQDAAVLGHSFTPAGLVALGGWTLAEAEGALASLVRRQMLTVETDPRSPERGSHKFTSALVRTVAYDTLSRRDRKARHLAAAAHLRAEAGSDAERAAVIAAHYLAARDNAPGDADAEEVTAQALAMLKDAGDRATALSSPAEALQHYEMALGLGGQPEQIAELSLAAALAANLVAAYDRGEQHGERALELYRSMGHQVLAGQALAAAANAYGFAGSWSRVVDELIPVIDQLADVDGATTALNPLLIVLSRAQSRLGLLADANQTAQRRLVLAEAAGDEAGLADALLRYGAGLGAAGMPVTQRILTEAALDIIRRERIVGGDVLALNNLAAYNVNRDLGQAVTYARDGLEVATNVGDRANAEFLLANLMCALVLAGEWDEVLELQSAREPTRRTTLGELFQVLHDQVLLARGEPLPAPAPQSAGDDLLVLGWAKLALAQRAEAAGDLAAWAALATEAADYQFASASIDDDFPMFWPVAMASALAVGDDSLIGRLYAMVDDAPPGWVPDHLRAHRRRFAAIIGARSGGDAAEVEEHFAAATEALDAFGAPFWAARTRLEHAEWLESEGRHDDARALLREAEDLFTGLRAAPWQARCRRAKRSAYA